jgi:hypothetical protein
MFIQLNCFCRKTVFNLVKQHELNTVFYSYIEYESRAYFAQKINKKQQNPWTLNIQNKLELYLTISHA